MEMSDEFNFFYGDNHQSFLQVDIIFFDDFFDKACPKYPE